MRWTRALPVFSIAFPLIYLATMYENWPVFTYVPKVGEFHWLRFPPPAAQGPGMFYYGWLLTAGITACVIALAASAATAQPNRRALTTLTWAAPACVLVALLYILSPWFTHA